MTEKNAIQKQREATWNGVIPSEGQGYQVGPKYVAGKTGAQDTTIPMYDKDRKPEGLYDKAKAGITVTTEAQFNPREWKARAEEIKEWDAGNTPAPKPPAPPADPKDEEEEE